MTLRLIASVLVAAPVTTAASAITEHDYNGAFAIREIPSQRVTVADGAYFPRVLLLDNGDLLASFKTGAGHVGKAGRSALSRSRDGGVTWSEPVTTFDLPDADDSLDACVQLRDGTVVFAAVSYRWRGEKYSFVDWHADTYVIRSSDRGETWTPPAKVEIAPFTWAYPFGRIIEMPNNELIMTLFGGYLPLSLYGSPDEDKDEEARTLRKLGDAKPEAQRGDFSFLLRSKDGGRTWGDPSVIARHHNEVCAIRLPDGRLMAAIREAGRGARLNVTFSSDQGHTWSTPTPLTENRQHPADVLALRNGEILLSYGERNKPYGVQAVVSRDSGATWDFGNRYVLAADGDHGDLGYPVTVERADGKLVTIYYVVYGQEGRFQMEGSAPAGAHTKVIIWQR